MPKNNVHTVIHNILSNWDPIGVGEELSRDEYQPYVYPIIQVYTNDKIELEKYLESMLTQMMGLEYNPNSTEQLSEIKAVCKQIDDTLRIQ